MQLQKNYDAGDWRKKYFAALESLETEQRQFRAAEGLLKRLAGRLCVASLGQSKRLDEELKHLQSVLRRDIDSDELERITAALTDAIGALDQSLAGKQPAPAEVAAPPAASAPVVTIAAPSVPSGPLVDEGRLRAVLATLLAELRRDADLLPHVDRIDAQLNEPMSVTTLPATLSALTDLVGQRIRRIERDKQELETLLSHMVGKLDEIGQFVAEQDRSRSEAQASSETLSTQLVGEMRAMGESVDSAVDVVQIRLQVRMRLDSIDRHLKAFREREAALTNAMRVRTERMQARVEQLEAEAKKLQAQLQDEQRLSTMDRLTRVPNRLAYDKRMQEELKRFERFGQPTCVVAWDVDHFKRFNDTYGHRAGDRVLRAVAECLSGRIRSTDFVARYGGEEFVMILCGAQRDAAARVIDAMRTDIAELKLHSNGTPLQITVSGGATMLQSGDTAAAAFDRADKAMYQAKSAGRNRCAWSESARA